MRESSMYSGLETLGGGGDWVSHQDFLIRRNWGTEKGSATPPPRTAGSESPSLDWVEISFSGAFPDNMICLSHSTGKVNNHQLGRNRDFGSVVLRLQTEFSEGTGYRGLEANGGKTKKWRVLIGGASGCCWITQDMNMLRKCHINKRLLCYTDIFCLSVYI